MSTPGCCVCCFNLCINQGATYTRIFLLTGPACVPVPGGTYAVGSSVGAFDLTGYTAAMQIKAYALSSTVLYDAGAANDIALGGTAGTITLTIPAADTEGFTWWNGVYDLVITDSYGVATRVLEGQVTVSPGVTP
jgi:hypothetical protein